MATVNQSVFKSLFIILAPFSHQACDLKLWVSVVCCDVDHMGGRKDSCSVVK